MFVKKYVFSNCNDSSSLDILATFWSEKLRETDKAYK